MQRAIDAKEKSDWAQAQEEVAIAYADAVGDLYLATNLDENILYQRTVDKLQSGGYTLVVVPGKTVGGEENYILKKDGEEISSLSIKKTGGENASETLTLVKTSTGGYVPYYVKTNDGKYYEILNKGNGEVELSKEETSESNIKAEASYRIEIETNDTENLEASYNESTGVITVTGKGKTSGKILKVKKINKLDNSTTDLAECTINVTIPLTQTEMENAYGNFVYYNVPYTDAYFSNYSYVANNGWRILNIEEDGEGTYNVEIISTGIPARLYYFYNQNPTSSSNANYKWWGDLNDTNRVAAVNTYYNQAFSTSWDWHNSGYYAAYGLKNNFAKITFNQGMPTSWGSSNYGLAYFNTINGINSASSAENKLVNTEEKVLAMFKEKLNKDGEISTLTNKVVGIREVELADIGERTGKDSSTEPAKITSTEDKNNTGLFQLTNVKNNTNHGLSGNTYSSSSFNGYWISTPDSNKKYALWRIYINSDHSRSSGNYQNEFGLRPVISFSGADASYNSTDNMWTIE